MLRYTYMLPLLLILTVFIADLYAPQDIEVHVLYLAVIALATKTRRYSLVVVLVLCSVLTVGVAFWKEITAFPNLANRLLTLLGLAATGWLGDQIITALQASKEDHLTRIYNRRGVEAEKKLRPTLPSAAILVDLDDFKRVNDTWGLLSGDSALREVADLLSTVARDTDIVGRWGGDEFIVLLWDTTWLDTQKVAERFFRILSNARVEVNAEGGYTRISASLGVIELRHATALTEVVKTAQAALKTSKSSGKNSITYVGKEGTFTDHDMALAMSTAPTTEFAKVNTPSALSQSETKE